MLIKHKISDAFPIKGKLHIPDVIGMTAAHKLRPGATVKCVFESLDGRQFEAEGKIAFELINYKGRGENQEKIGGSLIFEQKPNNEMPIGWHLFVHIEDL